LPLAAASETTTAFGMTIWGSLFIVSVALKYEKMDSDEVYVAEV